MKKIITAACLASLFALPTISSAAPYIGASLGSGKFQYTDTPDNVSTFALIGGYNFDEKWAAELSYKAFGESKISSVTTGQKVSANAFDLSAVRKFPLNDTFSLLVKAGLANVTTKLSSNSNDKTATNLSYGIGAQYSINKQFGLRAAYDVYHSEYGTSSAAVNDLSIAALYSF